jgi:pantoate kinase
VKETAQSRAPAAISSFFEICDTDAEGKRLVDLRKVGSRGGGFGLEKGVLTEVTVSDAKRSKIRVFINGQRAPQAKTTQTTIEALLAKTQGTFDVVVDHRIEVPVGAGFGTSAGGALTAGLALKKALDLPLTYNQIGTAAHIAEIHCQTGLDTATPLTIGGECMLVLEPGAPGIGVIDRIPFGTDHVIVAGVFGPTPKHKVLSSADTRQRVNRCGRKAMEAILAEPSLENFLACCWEFAQESGFASDRIRRLVDLANRAGAVGAAQNMVGEAVHAVVLEENAPSVEEAFKQVLPKQSVLVSRLDSRGARLVSEK